MKKKLIIQLLILLGATSLQAEEYRDTASIYFQQGKYNITAGSGKNISELEKFLSNYRYETDSLGRRLTEILINGSASPEGSVELNRNLSLHRAEVVAAYLKKYLSVPDSLYKTEYQGRDWSGLLKEVEEDKNVPDRKEILSFLSKVTSTSANQNHNHPLSELKHIGNGIPYSYLYNKLFSPLRKTEVIATYSHTKLPTDIPAEFPYLSSPSLEITEIEFTTGYELKQDNTEKRNFYMAIKSNLLYDALALPSLSAEFYLGKNISVVGNWTYGWWDNNRRHRYWRAYGGDLALRWWFGKAANAKPLTGHHVGIYAGALTYDFEFGGKGVMGGLPGKPLWDRCMFVGGVEYGYSLPIAPRLNFDFTLGIGYLDGEYIKYTPCGDHYKWNSTNKLRYFGPTKLEVSLTWLIGRGNVNRKEGGRR